MNKQRLFILILTVFTIVLPVSARDLTFFVWSDTHFQYCEPEDNTTLDIIEQMNALPGMDYPEGILSGTTVDKPEFLLHLGDITKNGLVSEWDSPELPAQRSYIQAIGQLGGVLKGLPTYEVLGNHDCSSDDVFLSMFIDKNGGTYYSFESQGVYFFVLKSYCSSKSWNIDTEQFEWLEAELGKLRRQTPVIIAMHHPVNFAPYSEEVHDRLERIIRRNNILLFLHGHLHSVEHSKWGKYNVLSPAGFAFCSDCDHCETMIGVVRITDDQITSFAWNWKAGSFVDTPSFVKNLKGNSKKNSRKGPRTNTAGVTSTDKKPENKRK